MWGHQRASTFRWNVNEQTAADDVLDSDSEDGGSLDGDRLHSDRARPKLQNCVGKVLAGIRMRPPINGVSLAEIHDRSAKRYERRWNPLHGAEQDYMDAILRAPELMFKMTPLVRDVGLACSANGQRGFCAAVQSLHRCKFYTMRHIWAMHMQPMHERVEKTMHRYDFLKKQIAETRNQYLHEISVLRGEARNRTDPDVLLPDRSAADIRCWYDPTSSLTEEELAFVARVVNEKLKMILDVNPNVAVCQAEVSSLMQRNENFKISELESCLAQKEEDISRLKNTVRDLEVEAGGRAPATGSPSKMQAMLERELQDLHEEVALLRKERQQDEARKLEYETDAANMRAKQDIILGQVQDTEKKLCQSQRSRDETAVRLNASLEENTKLADKVKELEETLLSISRQQMEQHAGKSHDSPGPTDSKELYKKCGSYVSMSIAPDEPQGTDDLRINSKNRPKRTSLLELRAHGSIFGDLVGVSQPRMDGYVGQEEQAPRRALVPESEYLSDTSDRSSIGAGNVEAEHCFSFTPKKPQVMPRQDSCPSDSSSGMEADEMPKQAASGLRVKKNGFDADVKKVDTRPVADQILRQISCDTGSVSNRILRQISCDTGSVSNRLYRQISCEVDSPNVRTGTHFKAASGRVFKGRPRMTSEQDHRSPCLRQRSSTPPKQITSEALSMPQATTPMPQTSFLAGVSGPQIIAMSSSKEPSQDGLTRHLAHETPLTTPRTFTPPGTSSLQIGHTSLSKEPLQDASGKHLTRGDVTRLILDPRAARRFESTGELEARGIGTASASLAVGATGPGTNSWSMALHESCHSTSHRSRVHTAPDNLPSIKTPPQDTARAKSPRSLQTVSNRSKSKTAPVRMAFSNEQQAEGA